MTYHDLWLPKWERNPDPTNIDTVGMDYHLSHRHYGQGFERMFSGGKPTAKPFSGSSIPINRLRNVGGRDPIRETLQGAVRGEIHTQEIDPRWLKMTQSAVTSPGVRYYAEDPTYRRTGETYADQGNAGNRFPVVYQHSDTGTRMILSGHHRAAAALALGKPLEALVINDEHWK